MSRKLNLLVTIKTGGILLASMIMLGGGCSQPAYIVTNELLIANGNYDEAISNYRSVSEDDVENHEPYYYLARAYFLRRDFSEAETEIDKAILLEPQMDLYRLLAAQIAFEQTDYFAATNHLINTLLLNDQNLEAYFLLAKTYLKTGNTEQALLQLETAISLEPLFFDARLLWCRTKFENYKNKNGQTNGKSPQSQASSASQLVPEVVPDATDEELVELISKLEEALLVNPASVEGTILLSELHLAVGNRLKAEQVLRHWLELNDPSSSEIIYRMAELKYAYGEFNDALKLLDNLGEAELESRILRLKLLHRIYPEKDLNQEAEQLFRENPDSLELMLLLAQLKQEHGKIQESQKLLERCIDRDPEFAFCYFELSKILNIQKDDFGSEWALKNAFKYEPYHREIRLEYATRLIEAKKPGEAWTVLTHSSLDQSDPDVVFLMGKATKDQKDYKKAIELFDYAQRHGYAIEVEALLAEIDILQRKYFEAEARINKLEQTAASHLSVVLVKTLLLESTDRTDSIPDLLEPYLRAAAGGGRVHLKLAEAQARMGNLNKALEILGQGLEQWPRQLDLVQSYTFMLGLAGQYDKAIYLLEDIQTYQHDYNLLFFYRLKEFYYLNGNLDKFKLQINPKEFEN